MGKRSSRATPFWEFVIAFNDPKGWDTLSAEDRQWWKDVAAQKNAQRKGPNLSDAAKEALQPGQMLRIEDKGYDLAFHLKPTKEQRERWEENKLIVAERKAQLEAKSDEADDE